MPDYILPEQAPTLEQMAAPDPHLEQLPKAIDISAPIPAIERSTAEEPDMLSKMAVTANPGSKFEPSFFDWDKSGTDRYVKSGHYKQIGFDPELGEGNELKYTQAQTNWDVLGRSIGGAGAGLWHGFKDQLASWKNVVSTFSSIPDLGAGYHQDQYEEMNRKNQEFDNNWHIFSGENPGFWNTVAREFQGTGHFLGALAEIAAETFATQAVIGATFGTAAPLEGIEAERLAAFTETELGATQVPEYIKNGLKMSDAVNTGKVTGNLWKSIGEYATEAGKYLPGMGNTVGYTGELLSRGAVGGTMATVGRGVGSLLNDIRSINTAVSFASGNAAGTYQQMVGDETEKWKKAHGGQEPGFVELQDIKDKAYKAAKTDHAINAYAMLFLEKAAFGNILNSRATLSGVVTNTERDIYGGIGKKPWYIESGDKAPLYVKQQIKWGNLRASTFNWGSEVGNYGQLGKEAVVKGLEFGAFNNAMSAIDAGTKAYYEAKFDNKPIEFLDAIHDGVGSQFTKEGAKSFISGFLQGALLLGLGGAALGRGRERFTERQQQRGFTPEDKQQLADYKTQVAAGQADVVDKFNEAWNDPLNPVKKSFGEMMTQYMFVEASKQNISSQNRKGFHDNQDDASREFILKMTKNGLADMWVEKMGQYGRSLSQDELCKMVGVDSTPENYKAIQAQIDELPGRVRDIKKIYKQVEEKLVNPFNEYRKDQDGKPVYTPGTPEFSAEQNNRKMYNMSKDYLIMAHDIAGQALKRQGHILNGSRGTTGIVDMPFGKNLEFTTVFSATSPELLDRQIYNASEELKTATTEQAKRAAQQKIDKIDAYKETLHRYLEKRSAILKKGVYDPAEMDKLRAEFKEDLGNKLHSYLAHTVDIRNAEGKVIESRKPPEENEVHDAMDKFMDYYDLGQEHQKSLEKINMLMDPRLIKHFEMSFINQGTKEGIEEKARKKDLQKKENTLVAKLQRIYTEGDLSKQQTIVDETLVELKEVQKELGEIYKRGTEGEKLRDIPTGKAPEQPKPAPVPTDTTPEPVPEEELPRQGSTEGDKRILETHESDLLAYLLKQPEGQPLNLDNKAMDLVIEETGLLQRIQAVHELFKGEERKKELTTIVKGYYDKLIDRFIEKAPKREDLVGEPYIDQVGDDVEGQPIYKVKVHGKEQGNTYSSVREANRALDKYIDKNHPLIADTGIREGQKIYDTQGAEFKVINRDEVIYLRPWKERTKNKDVQVSAEDLKEYSTIPVTKPDVTGKRFEGEKTVFKPSAGVNLGPYNTTGIWNDETRELAAKQLTEVISSIPVEHRATSIGFELVSEKNDKYTSDYRSPISPSIKQKADKRFWFIEYKGKRIGVVENPGKTVYITKDGRELSITDLKPSDIPDIFDIPTTGNYTTAEQIYNRLMDNHLNSVALGELIGNKTKVSLEGKVNLTTGYDYNWITTDETGPKLGELRDLQQGEHGLKMLVINNYKPDTVIQDTLTDKERAIAQGISPAGHVNYYTAVVQMANGDFVPVQLTPRQMKVDEIDNLLKAISNVNSKEKAIAAEAELDKLFIALSKTPDMQGVSVRLFSTGIGEENHLFVKVSRKIGETYEKLGSGNIMSNNFDTPQDLLGKLNMVLQSKAMHIELPEITTENLKYQPNPDDLSEMEASVHPDIIRNARVTYKVIDSKGDQRAIEDIPAIAFKAFDITIQPSYDTVVPISAKPIEPTQQLVSDVESTIQDMFDVIDELGKKPSSFGEDLMVSVKSLSLRNALNNPQWAGYTKTGDVKDIDFIKNQLEKELKSSIESNETTRFSKGWGQRRIKRLEEIIKAIDDLRKPKVTVPTGGQVSIADIKKQYTGGAQYFPINASGAEVAENLRAGHVTPEDVYAIKDEVGGKLRDWFERGYQAMTGKLFSGEVAEEKPVTSIEQALSDIDDEETAIRKKYGVPKVVDKTFTATQVTHIDTFNRFVKENLPEFLSVGELSGVVSRMVDNKVVVGQFVTYLDELGNVRGRIETKAGAPYKYHEAFHGIFRLLTTDQQRENLYREANKANPVTAQQLKEFQKTHPRYTNMSTPELRKEYQEEWMGDQFDKFSMDRDIQATSGIKGLFNRIWNWIRYIWDKLSGNRMRAMFHEVHTGDFKEAKLQDNSFTDKEQVGVSSPVPKAIPVGVTESTVKLDTGDKDVLVIRYLDSETAIKLSNDITASVLLDMQQQKFPSFDKAMETTLDRYRDTYNPKHERNIETYEGITNRGEKADWLQRLRDMHKALSEDKARKILKDNIQENLRIQGIKQSLIEEGDDDIEEHTGRSFNKPVSSTNVSIADKDLRTYIASTNVRLSDIGKTDAFGYTEHADGTPITQSVNSGVVYNGLLKLLSQQAGIAENFKAVLMYRDTGNNLDTTSFLTKWLRETGADIDKFNNTGVIQCADIAGANLFNKVMKTFMEVNNDYTTVVMDPGNNRVMVVDAGRKGPESYQFNQAANAFYQNYWKDIETSTNKGDKDKMYRVAVEPLMTFIYNTKTISAKNKTLSDQELAQLSQEISDNLIGEGKLGVALHPNYISFSIASHKDPAKLTPKQQQDLLMYPSAKPIDIEKMEREFLPYVGHHLNPFIRPEGKEATGAEKWLLNTFKNNAIFDSSVDGMSHTNSKGDAVYNYQFPSYNTDTARKLNDESFIRKLQDDPDTKGSWLLSNPEFTGMHKQIMSVGGLELKRTFLEKAETEEGEKELQVLGKDINKEGTDFSDFDDREYTAFNLATYDISTNPSAYHKDGSYIWYAVPVSLGPIAEKSTHHSVYIPVQRAVEGGKLTTEIKDILYNEVATEAARIQRVRDEIAEGRKAVIDRGGEWDTDYHDGAERGLKFFGVKDLISEELRVKIEAEPEKVEEHKDEIVKEAEKAIWKQVAAYKEMLKKQELITPDEKNRLLPSYLFKGIDKLKDNALNLKAGDFDHNLAQVYVNNYVGYLGISRLLYGDKAKVSKDTQDWWKRMAGNNAQGMSMNPVTATSEISPVDKYKLITYPAHKFTTIHGTTGEADDGQAYVTPHGYKSFLLGTGKLGELHTTLLTKVAAGRDLTLQEFRAMHESKAVMNSLKPVYKSEEEYLKCSVSMLNRQDVSYKKDGKWIAYPGCDILHDRLNSAEEQERLDPSKPVFIGNKSISKGKTANLVQEGDDISKAYHDIAAEYMRLQTATPMTPHKGNKSTQPDKQIDSNQNPEAPVHFEGKWQKTKDVSKIGMSAKNQRVLNNFLTAINAVAKEPISDLKDLHKFEFDMAKFEDGAIDTLMATGMDVQTIEFFTDHYNINLPPLVEKSTSVFMSNLIKGVTKEKVPMWKMTLRSDAGMAVIRKVTSLTPDGQPKTWDIVTRDMFKRSPGSYNVKHLSGDDKFYGLQVGDHVADRLRDNIPHYDDKGKLLYYYSEGMRSYMTVDEKQAGKFSDAFGTGFGARTPGTGFQSYRRVHWIDRLSDVLSNTAILSRDVMTATGHDYDVDSLFTAIKDTYINDKGERAAYGTSITDKEKFHEYLIWQINNNPNVKNKVSELKDTDAEMLWAEVSEDTKLQAKLALRSLGLPDTQIEYIHDVNQGRELNNGVLTNKALDAQLALLSGEHVSGGGTQARINRATSTKSVEDFAERLAQRLTGEGSSPRAKEVADRLQGKTGDLNSMLGQVQAYKTLQAGGDGIGGVANMIQATAVLNQFDKKLSYGMSYGGETYDEYKGHKGTPEPVRDQNADIIAQLHVDAPKNALPSKLNLTPEFATILTHAVKLGLPMDSALLYPQTQVWEDYARQVAYGTRNFKLGKQVNADVTLNRMISQLSDAGAKRVELTDDKIINYIKHGTTGNLMDDNDIDFTLLSDLRTMRDLTTPLRYMSRFMRFDTGRLLSSWEDIDYVKEALKGLGIGLDDEQFAKSGIPVDVRDIIEHRHGNMSANYQVLRALGDLGKKAFIDQSALFRSIYSEVMFTMNVPDWDKKFSPQLKHDIRSYLSIQALKTMLEQRGRRENLDTMNQNLLWDNQDSPKSIIHILTNLREQLKGRDTNYALNSFLNTVLKGKGTDINTVIANTWTKMSDQQQQKVVGAISDLVADRRGDVHQGGLALFNYLLVKDGGQFKSGSFIRFIPPHMMREWSDVMGKVTEALSKPMTDQQFTDLFGKTREQLTGDFVQAYATHTDTQTYIPQLSKVAQGTTPLYVRDYDKLLKRDGDKYIPVQVDGDSKQWKGAKAVFGEYPKTEAQQKTDDATQQVSAQMAETADVRTTLWKEHHIGTGVHDGQWVYITPEGVVRGITPEEMLEKVGGKTAEKPMTSEQPVVPSQQIEKKVSSVGKPIPGVGDKVSVTFTINGKTVVTEVEVLDVVTDMDYGEIQIDLKNTKSGKIYNFRMDRDGMVKEHTIGNKFISNPDITVNWNREVVKDIDWAKEIESTWKEKQLPAEQKERWLSDAREVYKSLAGKIPDNEILQRIKTCL